MKIEDAEKIIHYHIAELKDAPCSIGHHLNRKGGLMIHLNNVMKIAKTYFPDEETLHAVSLIHDVGKARVYKIDHDCIMFISNIDHVFHTLDMIKEADYDITEEERNAIHFHHGGWSPFKDIRMSELAIKLHFVDNLSTIREK